MTNKENCSALYLKMSDEFDEYRKELLSMSPEEILEHAYAYAMKQDILFAMEEVSLEDNQHTALLSEEHPLDKIFKRWEHLESKYMEDVRDNIYYAASEAFREKLNRTRNDER